MFVVTKTWNDLKPPKTTVAHKGQRYKLKLTQITKIYYCKLNQIHYE